MNLIINKIKQFLIGSSLFIILVLTWYLLTITHVVPRWILPTPEQTFWELVHLIKDGELPSLLLVSSLNIFPAFIFSIVCAIVVGTIVGLNSTVRRMFMPFFSALYTIPSLAWLSLIILFLGFTRQTIWTVIFISSFSRIVFSVIGGVRGVNRNWLLAAANLGLNTWETVYKVIIPASLPEIISGVRVGFGSAWRSLIGAEMLVVSVGGLGKYIWLSQWNYKFEQVLSGIFMIALVGVVFEELIFKRIEKNTLIRWGLSSQLRE